MKPIIFLTLFLFLSCHLGAKTQDRPAYLDQTAELKAVGIMKKGTAYPLVVFLPYTTGTAADFFDRSQKAIDLKAYWALIPQGRVQSADYLPDFQAYVIWYEERLNKDIQDLRKLDHLNLNAVYFAGYSVGGDLAWALTVRGVIPIKGAFIISSRCSYPPRPGKLTALKAKAVRLAFAIGQSDDPVRFKGMMNAIEMVDKAGLTHGLWPFSGGHNLPDTQILHKGYEFMLK